jgi:iron complex transport system ATP-binding protein
MSIVVRGLSFSYTSRPVLRGLDVDVGAGRLTAMLGRNGSGKSTLLRIMAGMLTYRSGSVKLLGKELSDYGWGERARTIGFLPQQHRAVFPFTVADVVLTGRAGHVALSPSRDDVAEAEQAMQRVGVWPLRDRAYTELSGGEQQMVLIARVLAQRPRIILLDEPTSHLDLHNQAATLRLLRDLVGSGLTVVCVLHDPNLAFAFADDFVFLKSGTCCRPGPGTQPWSADFLQDIYETEIHAVPAGGRAVISPAA